MGAWDEIVPSSIRMGVLEAVPVGLAAAAGSTGGAEGTMTEKGAGAMGKPTITADGTIGLSLADCRTGVEWLGEVAGASITLGLVGLLEAPTDSSREYSSRSSLERRARFGRPEGQVETTAFSLGVSSFELVSSESDSCFWR